MIIVDSVTHPYMQVHTYVHTHEYILIDLLLCLRYHIGISNTSLLRGLGHCRDMILGMKKAESSVSRELQKSAV